MILNIELSSETETRLQEEAQRRGLDLMDYARRLIEEGLPAQGAGLPSIEDLEDFFRAMADDSENLPILSDDALTRESIYADHD